MRETNMFELRIEGWMRENQVTMCQKNILSRELMCKALGWEETQFLIRQVERKEEGTVWNNAKAVGRPFGLL